MALTLRTDDELERALDLLCPQEGLSCQELIRRAVLERAERDGEVDVEFLDLEDLVMLERRLGAGPVRDVRLLEAACARPPASVFGAAAYPTLAGKAAALLHSIVANHALVDGNKRLGWLATVVFLDLNGRSVMLDDEAAFTLVMDVAERRLDVEGIAGVLEAALTVTRDP